VAEKLEIRLKGRAVSRGIGIGPAVCLFGGRRQFFRREISASEIEAEISRVMDAVDAARISIQSDIDRTKAEARDPVVDLLESHLFILQDPSLISRINESISRNLVNAEWAIQTTFDDLSLNIKQSKDPHIREKYLDVEDVAERLLTAINADTDPPVFESGAVVAASELRASTILRLLDSGVAGIVTEHGGWTSHSSILAREFEIPNVTGIARLFNYVSDGLIVAVDGYNGEVCFDPSDDSINELNRRAVSGAASAGEKFEVVSDQLSTLDGRAIVIRTNTVSVDSYKDAESKGAFGIGLYRSESLIGKFGRMPTEDEQADEYDRIASATGSAGTHIRTFDIDADQYSNATFRRQKNPALGLRAIRLGLRSPELLIPQIRAVLRASHDNYVSIIIPMVSSVAEINEFRGIVKQQHNELTNAQIPVGTPRIGAMIEIPAAALLADQLATVADFLCLGTNDLAQYILAADRDNEYVSEWFRTLHPAMLRVVRSVINSCKAAEKPLVVCGEMAGSPFYIPVLIGLGATDLSMNPGSIDAARRVISGIAYEEAATLVRKIEVLTTPEAIEKAVAETARQKWPHLYPPGFLDQQPT
jgi:phosphoenolpyruvate-protein phosphotransferase (PTS system enzyme I)